MSNSLNDIKHLQSIVEPPKFIASKTFVQRPTAFLRFVQVTALHMAFHHAERWTRHGKLGDWAQVAAFRLDFQYLDGHDGYGNRFIIIPYVPYIPYIP